VVLIHRKDFQEHPIKTLQQLEVEVEQVVLQLELTDLMDYLILSQVQMSHMLAVVVEPLEVQVEQVVVEMLQQDRALLEPQPQTLAVVEVVLEWRDQVPMHQLILEGQELLL